jgi:uncharacterized protein YqjF (DUF2071 family)
MAVMTDPADRIARRAAWRAPSLLARLRRHPIPIQAHLQDCLTLTYALPPHVLCRLLPPGLELETSGGFGFVAVALVQTRSLRPAWLPKRLGQDFFLAGYRVFARFHPHDGHAIRGLRILRSDADRALMVAGGNLLTHYNYHRCDANIESCPHRIHLTVHTPDHVGDLEVIADLETAALPTGSPFATVREARRFAGPLPFTFDYEQETHAIIAIKATRTNWRPAPVSVDVQHIAFFDQPVFDECTPILAAAFHVTGIDYRWERGVRHALSQTRRVRRRRSFWSARASSLDNAVSRIG